MIEHPVNHDARNGNVKPNRQSPACDAFVKVESLFPGAIKGGEHERNNHGRENRMRPEQGKINGTNHALPREASDAVMRVVPEIAGKEKRGCPKCRQHADFVSENTIFADKNITKGEQDCGGSIQRGVDSGKIGKLKAHTSSLQVAVNS
jgi:hypothetical protein